MLCISETFFCWYFENIFTSNTSKANSNFKYLGETTPPMLAKRGNEDPPSLPFFLSGFLFKFIKNGITIRTLYPPIRRKRNRNAWRRRRRERKKKKEGKFERERMRGGGIERERNSEILRERERETGSLREREKDKRLQLRESYKEGCL